MSSLNLPSQKIESQYQPNDNVYHGLLSSLSSYFLGVPKIPGSNSDENCQHEAGYHIIIDLLMPSKYCNICLKKI